MRKEEQTDMDNIDISILNCLHKNARTKASAISEEINLSVSAVTDRIKRMEAGGIIKGYTVLLDQKQIGNDVMALMQVSLDHPRFYDSFSQMVEENPNIISCYYLTGDYDFILKIVADSSQMLEKIHTEIKSFDGVCGTKTYFVLKTQKDNITFIPSATSENKN